MRVLPVTACQWWDCFSVSRGLSIARLPFHDGNGLACNRGSFLNPPQCPERHTLTMCLVQSVGNLNGVAQNLIQRQRAYSQPLSQRLPFQVLHHQEVNAILLSDVIERADVRMIQTGDGAGFSLESLAQLGLVC